MLSSQLLQLVTETRHMRKLWGKRQSHTWKQSRPGAREPRYLYSHNCQSPGRGCRRIVTGTVNSRHLQSTLCTQEGGFWKPVDSPVTKSIRSRAGGCENGVLRAQGCPKQDLLHALHVSLGNIRHLQEQVRYKDTECLQTYQSLFSNSSTKHSIHCFIVSVLVPVTFSGYFHAAFISSWIFIVTFGQLSWLYSLCCPQSKRRTSQTT